MRKHHAYCIAVIIALYQLLALWMATHIVDEQFLRRKVEYDLGHEVVKETFYIKPTQLPNSNNYCNGFPSYSQMLVEQNGFSCNKSLHGHVQNTKPNDHVRFEQIELMNTSSCTDFIKRRKYLTVAPNPDEVDFPLAYSIVVHKDAAQVERLIRSIYRSHNHYCIHVDIKSADLFETLSKYASCFDNVNVIKDRVNVTYAHYTRLVADFKCMDVLLRRNRQWKYLINLCGQDFPLKTNYQMVKRLRGIYPAQSSIYSVAMDEKSKRIEYSFVPTHLIYQRPPYFVNWHDWSGTTWFKSLLRRKLDSFPLGPDFPVKAGSAYNIFTREFINWTLSDPVSRDVINWSRDTYTPDEFVWATLARYDGAPGSLPAGREFDINGMNSLARLVKWEHLEDQYPPCTVRYQRGVCIFGVDEVGWLLRRPQFFANKFVSTDPKIEAEAAIECLEKELRRMEFLEACGGDTDAT